MRLPDFEAWAIFATIAEHRTFSDAADALGVSKATVSKAITRLEASLGTALFHRTSRRLTLTEAGHTLSEHARRILAEGHAAEETAHDAASAPAGLIRVAAPMTFGLSHVAPAIADFMTAHPAVQVDLRLSDARVDVVGEGFDIALRIADLPDSSLRARRLAPIEARVVASPGYVVAHGNPRHPADLAERDVFAYANVPNGAWLFRNEAGEEIAVRPNGRFTTDNGDAMLPLLRAGLGIARLPDFIVDADIAAGQLVKLLEQWTIQPTALHLVTPPSALRPVRVELLIEFLADRFRQICAGRA